jgi:OOP family OmpA-OmpF porin
MKTRVQIVLLAFVFVFSGCATICPDLRDTDGDGVNDLLDACPNTPIGAVVDKDGCPIDSDGDGVYDGLDKCPNTPKGAKVDKDGCPIDSDGDGVYDGLDKCPNTPKGAKVDAKGCPPKISLAPVYFDVDKSEIRNDAERTLGENIATLKANPSVRVRLEGHTDSDASDKYNLGLSMRRVEAVRDYLISRGISRARLEVMGKGEGSPAATNATKGGKQANRRVELVVISQ